MAGEVLSTDPLAGLSDHYAQSRAQFSDELNDPALLQQINTLTANEVGGQTRADQQAFIETLFNRAESRGQSLHQVASDRSYYPGISFRPRAGADYSDVLNFVLHGSDISRGATGNASGRVGFAGGPQTASFGSGERYGIEGPDLKVLSTDPAAGIVGETGGGPRAPAAPVLDAFGQPYQNIDLTKPLTGQTVGATPSPVVPAPTEAPDQGDPFGPGPPTYEPAWARELSKPGRSIGKLLAGQIPTTPEQMQSVAAMTAGPGAVGLGQFVGEAAKAGGSLAASAKAITKEKPLSQEWWDAVMPVAMAGLQEVGVGLHAVLPERVAKPPVQEAVPPPLPEEVKPPAPFVATPEETQAGAARVLESEAAAERQRQIQVAAAQQEPDIPAVNLEIGQDGGLPPETTEGAAPPTGTVVRAPITLDEIRLRREKADLQHQNEIAERMTGQRPLDDAIAEIDQKIEDLVNAEAAQRTIPTDVGGVPPEPLPTRANLELGQRGAAAPRSVLQVSRRGGEKLSATQERQVTKGGVGEHPGVPPRQNVPAYGGEVRQEAGRPPSGGGRVEPAPTQPVTEPTITQPADVGARQEALAARYGIEPGAVREGQEVIDAARARTMGGTADPYAVATKLKAGKAITADELADVIVEHERLANRAEGYEQQADKNPTPQNLKAAETARTVAEDFARNVVKPAGTQWGEYGRTLQRVTEPEPTTLSAIREIAVRRLQRELKAAEKADAVKLKKKVDRQLADAETGRTKGEAAANKLVKGQKKLSDAEVKQRFSDLAQKLTPCKT